MKALLDTNILVDYLNGVDSARLEVSRYEAPLISSISWMEVMLGCRPDDEHVVRRFLARFAQVEIDFRVAEIAVKIRRSRNIRLPDAMIWASARARDALLVSRNTRDLPSDEPDVRVPYTI